jgi:hypothetical protein
MRPRAHNGELTAISLKQGAAFGMESHEKHEAKSAMQSRRFAQALQRHLTETQPGNR